jgi:hypothetical protein
VSKRGRKSIFEVSNKKEGDILYHPKRGRYILLKRGIISKF